MRPGGILRLVLLPEFGRGLRGARGAAGRIARLAAALAPPRRPPEFRTLLLPAGRTGASAGVLLASAGAALLVYGLAGLGGAGAQTVDPGLFAVEDAGTRKILGFLSGFDLDDSTALGRMLFVFNSGVLLLAGFLLIWHTVTGSVDTAREGRWGFGGWEVLRIVIAVALMAPLPGGASGGQHVVVGLARVGGDFATAVWEPLAVETLGKGRAVLPTPRENEWRGLLSRTLISEICMYVANAQAARAGDAPYVRVRDGFEVRGQQGWMEKPDASAPAVEKRRWSRAKAKTGAPSAEIRHYDGTGNGMPRDMCGAVRFVGLEEDGARGIAARGHRSAWGVVHAQQLVGLARRIGDRFVPGSPAYGDPLPDIAASLDGIGTAESYRAIVELRIKEAEQVGNLALRDAVAEDAKELGWLGAASFVVTLAGEAGKMQSAARNVPRASLPSPEVEKWSKDAWAAVQATLASLGQSVAWQPIPVALSGGGAGPRATVAGRGDSALDRIMHFIDFDTVLAADGDNPLLDLTATGHALLDAGLAAIGALAGTAVGVNVLEVIPLFGKGLDFFEASWDVMDGFVTMAIGVLLVAGAVLAYFLPAIPFIRFLFGILGWLLAVVEAVLAVTVFLAAHVTRGEGNRLMVEGARQGWLFFPGLLLRPVLMLFGLVMGYFVFVVAMGLFNETWLVRMADASSSGGLGPVSFLAMLAIYVFVAYGILNACFKLIDVLPDAVLGWIGAQGTGWVSAGEVGAGVTGGFGRLAGLRGARPNFTMADRPSVRNSRLDG